MWFCGYNATDINKLHCVGRLWFSQKSTQRWIFGLRSFLLFARQSANDFVKIWKYKIYKSVTASPSFASSSRQQQRQWEKQEQQLYSRNLKNNKTSSSNSNVQQQLYSRNSRATESATAVAARTPPWTVLNGNSKINRKKITSLYRNYTSSTHKDYTCMWPSSSVCSLGSLNLQRQENNLQRR